MYLGCDAVYINTDVSAELAASVFRVEELGAARSYETVCTYTLNTFGSMSGV
jgi:hypothetical protein